VINIELYTGKGLACCSKPTDIDASTLPLT